MARASPIIEGNQSTEGILVDFEIEMWKVEGLEGSQQHDVKAARDVIGVNLGMPWRNNVGNTGGLFLQEKRLVQWVGPEQAIFALVYLPPGRFGSLQNSSTFGRSDPFPIELPVWSSKPLVGDLGPIDNFQQEPPVIINRGRSVRAEYRTRPNSERERILRASGLFNGDLFLIGAIQGVPNTGMYYQFTGATTQDTSRGTVSVAYWFSRMGAVSAIPGFKIGSAIDLPFLGPFSEYETNRTSSTPVVSATDESLFTFTPSGALPGL